MPTDIIITNSPLITGIDEDDLHLAATIANVMYDNTIPTKKQLQDKLEAITRVRENYPKLGVQFFERGMFVGVGLPTDDPPFTAIITDTAKPNTMILAWRGSTVAMDWIQNMHFLPTHTENIENDVQVHSAYYELIKNYFDKKGKDLKKLVETGNVTPGKEGKPIERIILTGHSMGGGIAQVAHQVLKADSSWFSEANKAMKANKAIDKDVEVHTIAFSSPMTIAALDDYEIENMTNIVLQDDIFPRVTGNEAFIRNFLNNLGETFLDELGETLDTAGQKLAAEAYNMLRSFLGDVLDNNRDVLGMYRHVGDIVYYATHDAQPEIYNNETFNDIEMTANTITTGKATSYHINTVSGPGLAWAN